MRFEPAGFDHATIGYPLSGGHTDLACSGCHNTLGVRDREVRLFKGRYGALTRTYLGLSQSCGGCHVARDPHAGQFEGRECAACHDETVWAPAERFDHANARYPLTGRHGALGCAGCHRGRIVEDGADTPALLPATTPANGSRAEGAIRYRPLAFEQCSSCHRDAHAGELGPRCASCHGTSGWNRIPRGRFEGDFDHTATGFPLDGRHADASCASCHLDYHLGAFEGSASGPECAACHTSQGWAPSEFDVFKHDETAFALTGAHRVVPCLDCHGPETPAPAGASGRELDPHDGEPVSSVPALRIHLGTQTCASCHARSDPHAGQFEGTACESCHFTASFTIESFDHSTTRFALEGSHEAVSCAACHEPESGGGAPGVIRYRPLDSSCRSCHGESREPSEVGVRQRMWR